MSSATSSARFSGSWPVGLLREVVLALPVLLTVYLGVRQRGPWRWLVDLQLRLFKGFYPGYTFGVCCVLVLAATALLHRALDRARWPARPVLGRVLSPLVDAWVGLPDWLGVMVFVGAILLGMGLWFYLPAQLAGPRTEVRAEDLEAGVRPESRWLVIEGRALVEQPVVWGKGGREDDRAVCLVSERWRPGEPVAVVLSASSASRLPADARPTAVEGIATLRGVPGLTRSSFERNGLALADGALYVEVGTTPEGVGWWGVLAGVGAGIVAVLLLVGLVRSAWKRRAVADPLQAAQSGPAVGGGA
jgi:hypothetical protein